MSSHLLIDSVVRQVTVLLAQLATAGGVRAPLAQVANQVFLELSRELEAQGVTRRVSADMFGMTLRSYQRKTRRLRESATERGRSLWEVVYAFVRSHDVVQRDTVLERFARDDEGDVRGILRDLVESGLVFVSGPAEGEVYRAARDEAGGAAPARAQEGLEELVWALLYHEGPMAADALAARTRVEPTKLAAILKDLENEGRVRRDASDATRYSAPSLFVPLAAEAGWEAAVYDHFRALVRSICAKLAADPAQAAFARKLGGSTYSFDVDESHPLFAEAMATLDDFRTRCSDLRARVNAYNAEAGRPRPMRQVIAYAGQCLADAEEADAAPQVKGAGT
jgi:hypothetical protein